MVRRIVGAFMFFRSNQAQNLSRNLPTFMKEEGIQNKLFKLQGARPDFYYHFDVDNLAIAEFIGSNRVLRLSSSFDPSNTMECLVLLHELIHAFEDAVDRSKNITPTDWKKYFEQFDRTTEGKPKNYILTEASAYAVEIEAMNALLDGELKTAVDQGEQFNFDRIKMRLSARTTAQIGFLGMTLSLVGPYYREGGKLHGYPKAFMEKIAEAGASRGYENFYPN